MINPPRAGSCNKLNHFNADALTTNSEYKIARARVLPIDNEPEKSCTMDSQDISTDRPRDLKGNLTDS